MMFQCDRVLWVFVLNFECDKVLLDCLSTHTHPSSKHKELALMGIAHSSDHKSQCQDFRLTNSGTKSRRITGKVKLTADPKPRLCIY